MAIWLIAGSIALVEAAVLVWVWALCRAAALADRRALAARGARAREACRITGVR